MFMRLLKVLIHLNADRMFASILCSRKNANLNFAFRFALRFVSTVTGRKDTNGV